MDWWDSFYNDTLAEMILVRSDAKDLDATLTFLTQKLNLGPGSVAFDQCCGIGSLSLGLAQRGMHMIGVDVTESYILRAKQSAIDQKNNCDFHRGDAFEFQPDIVCDGGFNWYSSFGYTPDDDRNSQMLQRAHEAIKPDGYFALDIPNAPGVLRNFLPTMLRRHQGVDGEVLLVRESQFDISAGMLLQDWLYILPDGRRIGTKSSVKLYMPNRLAEMMRSCGFTDVKFFGSVAGEDLSIDSPRCICLAKRS